MHDATECSHTIWWSHTKLLFDAYNAQSPRKKTPKLWRIRLSSLHLWNCKTCKRTCLSGRRKNLCSAYSTILLVSEGSNNTNWYIERAKQAAYVDDWAGQPTLSKHKIHPIHAHVQYLSSKIFRAGHAISNGRKGLYLFSFEEKIFHHVSHALWNISDVHAILQYSRLTSSLCYAVSCGIATLPLPVEEVASCKHNKPYNYTSLLQRDHKMVLIRNK